ncbi:hypothetical protein, partial [Alistipes communis]|uniref:hypothetical protein n=1 Tax=Alistipes communis TaxID=2585118 RepID=UPI003AF7724E
FRHRAQYAATAYTAPAAGILLQTKEPIMTSILRIERPAYTTGSNSYKERFRIKLDCFPTKIGILFRISYFLENLMTSDLFFLSAATGKGSRGDGDSGKKRIFAPEIIHRKNIRQR